VALQYEPALQSPSALQVPRHEAATPLQVYAPQSPAGSVWAEALVHVPSAPGRLQAWQSPVQPWLQHTPSAQALDWHSPLLAQPTPLALKQVAEPLQVVSSAHSLAGSWYAGTLVQVPVEPAMLQARQVPVQVESQQTPSAQKPETHWLAAVQEAAGCFFGVHVPALQ
jgi:hypothetical protein